MPGTPRICFVRKPQSVETGAKLSSVRQEGDDSICRISVAQGALAMLQVVTEFYPWLSVIRLTNIHFASLLSSQVKLWPSQSMCLGLCCVRNTTALVISLASIHVYE